MDIPIEKFEDYLKNKNLKERTIQNYIYCFNKFIAFGPFSQKSVSKFLSEKNNRNPTSRSFLINFKRFLMINHEELGISQGLKLKIADVELPKLTGRIKKRLIKPLKHENIAILEKYLETEQLKLQLLLSYYCALRLGELLHITILSFDWDGWKKDQSKMGECRVYGKGDKEGIALVPSELMKRIANFIRTKGGFNSINDRLFVSNKMNINFKNRSRVWQMKLRKAGIDSGITKLDDEGKPIVETVVHPHRLRHSYANYLLNVKKLNIRQVQEVLRHSSIQSTEIYTYVDKEDLKRDLPNEVA